MNPDPYSGDQETGPIPVTKAGNVASEHKFVVTEEFSPFQPYRALIAERLKITGRGSWPMGDFLSGPLWLPFQEPAILLHGGAVTWTGPDDSREDPEENLKLAKIWDARGLLALFHECPFPQFP